MASVVGKRINGRTYYYLVESARVNGRPRVTAQQYLGTAADIARAVAAVTATATSHSRHLPFGDAAAVWDVLCELDVAGVVDAEVGRQRAKVSAGRLFAVAVLAQAVAPQTAPCADQGRAPDVAAWWPGTSASHFVKPRLTPAMLGRTAYRRAFRRAAGRLEEIERALGAAMVEQVGSDAPVLVLDVPRVAAGVAPAASAAPDRPDRPAPGLGLVVTLDGAVPLAGELYAPASTSFGELTARLVARYRACGGSGPVTVIADAGQNSLDLVWPRFRGDRPGRSRAPEVSAVGALSPHDHPEPAGLPLSGFAPVDPERFPGVTARDTRAWVAGAERRCIVVHSASLREAQARALAADLAHAERRLAELAVAVRAGGSRAASRERVAAEVARITRFRWGERLLSTRLTGTRRGALELAWSVDEGARCRLESELFGRQLLVTDHEDWPVARVLTAYRARYRVEATLRHLHGAVEPTGTATAGDPDPADERMEALLTVLATAATHLLRHRAQEAGIDVSARELMHLLAGIQETELRAPSTGGRPRTARLLAERSPVQQRLFDLFALHRYAPAPRPK